MEVPTLQGVQRAGYEAGGMSETNGKNSAGKSGPQRDEKGRLTGGNPGNAGGGRPPNEFRASMRELVQDKKCQRAVKKILSNPDHPQFTALWGKVTAYGHGQPTQTVEHQGLGILTPDERRRRVEAILATRFSN